IREFRALLESYGLDYAMFGHVDVGCLHVRPALDLKEPEQERWLREISDGVMQLVRKHGGVMWGEHGRGFRSEYTPQFFGELYPDLRRIKEAFDPCNRLNPGKIVTPLSSSDEPVGVDAPLRGQQDRQIHPDLRSEFDAAVSCNGTGACFNYQPHDVMCPSSRATRDRRHSPKGRAGLLREWLRQLSVEEAEGRSQKAEGGKRQSVGASPARDHRKPITNWCKRLQNSWRKQQGECDFSHEVYEAMSGCLACKACATQCPIHVDVPEFRAKFLDRYHTRYLRPLRDHFVGSTEWSGRWLSHIPAFSNTLLGVSVSQALLRRFGLVDVPRFSPESTWGRLRERGIPTATPATLKSLTSKQKSASVVLTLDAFTTFYESPVVLDLHDVLQELGLRVYLAPFLPNGKPLHVKGFLSSFRKTAEKSTNQLREIAETGVPLVGIDPSVVLTYRDEYPKILDQPDLGFTVLLSQEFLLQHPERLMARKSVNPMASQPYQLFGHCMEKTGVLLSQKQWQEVFQKLGLDLTLVAVGCCGMAGTYGHEREHQAESREIFEMSWQQRIPEDALAREQVLATGYSCRAQTKRFAGFVPRHPMQALLAELRHTKLPHG
ncbi:MAG: FAD-linked oxidase C-terminal domain-containing protein, partial [SAR324 cluster bacterium]|nr:FAD-linked oxidase C-terminal domain-containing protein [SAR324 cluster bacterium]